jgi:hypothetical protein
MREDPVNVGTVTLAPTQNVAQEAVCTSSAIQRIVVTQNTLSTIRQSPRFLSF